MLVFAIVKTMAETCYCYGGLNRFNTGTMCIIFLYTNIIYIYILFISIDNTYPY